MTKRVAIFASGGGSNAVKLMESMQGDHPAMPALIVTNQPNAGVIQQAERFGVACDVIDHKPYAGDRVAFETEIQNRLIPYQIDMICLAGFMRVLTAGFHRSLERSDVKYSSLTLAEIQRAKYPCPRD